MSYHPHAPNHSIQLSSFNPPSLGPAEQPASSTPRRSTSPPRQEVIIFPSRPLFTAANSNRNLHGRLSQRQQSDDDLFLDSETRPSYPFLTCLLLILTILMLINLEAVVTPSPNRHHKDSENAPSNDIPITAIDAPPLNSHSSRLIDGEKYSFLDPFRENSGASMDDEDGDPIAEFLNQVFVTNDNDPEHKGRQWGSAVDSVEKYDSSLSFPTASFNLKGRYATFSVPIPSSNQTDSDSTPNSGSSALSLHNNQGFSSFASNLTGGHLIDQGILHTVLLSRPSVIHSVRLATIKLDLESKLKGAHGRKTIALAGLDLRDVSTLTFQGKISPEVFNLPLEAVILDQHHNSVMESTLPMCNLFASLRFDRFPGASRSARPLETQQNGGNADWGFDLSDFGNGGEWDRRRRLGILGHGHDGTPIGHYHMEQKGQFGVGSLSDGNETTNEAHIEAENVKIEVAAVKRRSQSVNDAVGDDEFVLDLSEVNGTTKTSTMSTMLESQLFQDLEGIIVSPNCGVRIVLSGVEIDLASLANKVIHFAFFFVLKGLLEVRFFISQIKYTEGGGSSPQKVCFVSLGLHMCVDCFEACILGAEAVASSFMSSTFIILSILKFMFVMVIQFRYFISVLKARFSDENDVENLARYVKLNIMGSIFIVLFMLRLLPLVPASIAALYLFWVPQIVYDGWKGNRLSLSPYYIVGMSVCRLAFPLYLWGCPASIFDGEMFKSLPSAPNLTLCTILVVVVAVQVVLIFTQRIFGPRAFIPDGCLPEVYNYYRPIPKVKDPEEGRGYECVICMTDISYTGRTLVTTPCEHHFHDTCLQQWMDVKAECPTCRRSLPPFP